MGATRTDIFTAEQNRIATFAKAFAHPARVAIIEFLIRQKNCICRDIVDEIGLAQPTVSQHLKELKNLGLIRGNVEGAKICYCIDRGKWEEIKSTFDVFFSQKLPDEESCC